MPSPQEAIATYLDDLVGIRRDLHQHPEIGFEVSRTAEVVARELERYGIKVHRGIGKTGVVGTISGRNGPGRSIGLRAELDALPIEETTNLPYRSRVPGFSHACGHDGHMVMLLGAARYLAETRDFSGTATIIFQPAEEGQGGARAMLADKLFDRFPCDEIYALHNDPNGPRGSVRLRSGATSAAADFFDIEIHGRGAHAAQPHHAVDPVAVAVTIAQSLPTIVSSSIDPLHPAVLCITRIEAGNTYNVIPDSALMSGTIRTFDPQARSIAAARLREICAGIASAYGATAKVTIHDVFSVLENWPEQTAAATAIAAELFGKDKVDPATPPRLTSEDFADMLKVVPGSYFFLGQQEGPALHNPAYAFDEEIIPVGALLLASLVQRRSVAA